MACFFSIFSFPSNNKLINKPMPKSDPILLLLFSRSTHLSISIFFYILTLCSSVCSKQTGPFPASIFQFYILVTSESQYVLPVFVAALSIHRAIVVVVLLDHQIDFPSGACRERFMTEKYGTWFISSDQKISINENADARKGHKGYLDHIEIFPSFLSLRRAIVDDEWIRTPYLWRWKATTDLTTGRQPLSKICLKCIKLWNINIISINCIYISTFR